MFNRKAIKRLQSQVENRGDDISDLYSKINKMSQIQNILVSELFRSKTKNISLLPCPFCGSKPSISFAQKTVTVHYAHLPFDSKEEKIEYSISCSKIKCICPGIKSTDFDNMVEKWNGRSKENS